MSRGSRSVGIERLIGTRGAILACALVYVCTWWAAGLPAADEGQLTDAQIEEPGNDVLSWLEHVNEFLKGEQWDDAVETLRRVMEHRGTQLMRIPVAPQSESLGFASFVSLSEYCQMQLASWHERAPQALAVYRQRVDPAAARWLKEAVDERSETKLQRIVDELMLSSQGDEALLRLGDMALERGNYTLARRCWESISRQLRVPPSVARLVGCPPGCSWWCALRGRNLDQLWPELSEILVQPIEKIDWLAYPDADVSLPGVRARLVLASMLEGSFERAQLEFEMLRRLHPEAAGTLAGRQGKYADLLAEILRAGESWPGPPELRGWTTLAGSPARNRVVPEGVDVARQAVWRTVLPRLTDEDDRLSNGRVRVAETATGLLSYHAAVSDGVVFVCQSDLIRAFELSTGKPAWPRTSAGRTPQERDYGAIFERSSWGGDAISRRSAHAGVPRYCVTVDQDRLFARMGTAWTGGGNQFALRDDQRSCIVGIDLRTQKLLFDPLTPGDTGWEFETAPVADGSRLYASLRRRDSAHARVKVACYAVETGRLIWEREIARAEALGDVLFEMSNSSLSLHDDMLCYNTNLGAIVALRISDGQIRWLCRYRRSGLSGGDPDRDDQHSFRDLTPCLVDRGIVIAAAGDCDRIFAVDAEYGQLLWTTAAGVAVDAVHLLGVSQDRLVASGDYLYWIDIGTGNLVSQFPAPRGYTTGFAGPEPRGHGRGILAGGQVYWPTRDSIYVFDQRSARQVRQPIELATWGILGGNLVIDSGVMLICSPQELVALNQTGWPELDVRGTAEATDR